MNIIKKYYYLSNSRSCRRTFFNIEESSSLSDVAFLLLIFFIVTSSFVIPQGLYLSLPNKNGNTILVKKKNIIQITPLEEDYLINQQRYTSENLEQYLKTIQQKDFKANKKNKEPLVMIQMDDDIYYQRLIDLLTILKKYKWKNISFL